MQDRALWPDCGDKPMLTAAGFSQAQALYNAPGKRRLAASHIHTHTHIMCMHVVCTYIH